MRHVDSIDALSLDGCELTIGSFDGIHLGHRELIHQMLREARAENLPTTVLSFFPHPSVVLRGSKPAFYLSSPDEKARRLGALGIDHVINQRFDLELSHLKADAFLDWIESRLHPKGLWVGPDFALGYRREGDISFLASAAGERGFRLHVVEPALIDGEVVSSTRIRRALRAGEVATAWRLLGAPFSLPGEIGAQSPDGHDPDDGRFSLEVSEERACPSGGLYAGRLEAQDVQLPALIHVRHAPQSDDDDPRPSALDIFISPDAVWSPGKARLAFLKRLGPAASTRLSENSLARWLPEALQFQSSDHTA
jgi:riboflavin kinase/FMN adenylyltransferase